MRGFFRSKGALWLAGAALLVFGFARFTSELLEGEVQALDRHVLEVLSSARTPTLTSIALDLTALGSPTLLFLFSTVAIVAFLLRHDRAAALQVLCAAVLAPLLSSVLKNHIERARPTEVPRLVEVSGFSYPSGHSVSAALFYLTLAIVWWTRTQSRSVRVGVLVAAIVITVLVAASRSYLGAHYPSDTLAGLMIGAGAALLLAGAFSVAREKHTTSRA